MDTPTYNIHNSYIRIWHNSVHYSYAGPGTITYSPPSIDNSVIRLADMLTEVELAAIVGDSSSYAEHQLRALGVVSVKLLQAGFVTNFTWINPNQIIQAEIIEIQ